jgi:predicted lipoprotein
MKALAALAALAVALAIVRPWTIVPIETATPRAFDPVRYVESIWDARVLPAAEQSAIELRSFMEGPSRAGTARAVFVKGRATIATADRQSRVGLAHLVLPWAKDSARGAAIQLGPVIRGTALRDALEFVRFTDFVNQLEYAAVAGALNDRVLSTVLAASQHLSAGSDVTFVGAVPISAGTTTLEIVPVRLSTTGARP